MKKSICVVTNFLFVVFFIYVLILNVLKLAPNNIWYILIVFLLCIPLYLLIKKLHKCNNDKLLKRINLAIQIINFFVLIFLGINLAVNFTWDYGCIQSTAVSYAETNFFDKGYYMTYSNNQLLGVSVAIFYKILHILFGTMQKMDYLYSSIVLNSILISGSIFLYYLIAKKTKGEKFALLLTIFLVTCLPISRIRCYTLFRYSSNVHYSTNNIFIFEI